jgi:hypothetical protein
MDELIVDGAKYISSKRAARLSGYSKDYIGQLCRAGKMPSKMVGRNWYVLESALTEHRKQFQGEPVVDPALWVEGPQGLEFKGFGAIHDTVPRPRLSEEHIKISYEPDERPLIPTVVKPALQEVREENQEWTDASSGGEELPMEEPEEVREQTEEFHVSTPELEKEGLHDEPPREDDIWEEEKEEEKEELTDAPLPARIPPRAPLEHYPAFRGAVDLRSYKVQRRSASHERDEEDEVGVSDVPERARARMPLIGLLEGALIVMVFAAGALLLLEERTRYRADALGVLTETHTEVRFWSIGENLTELFP